MTKKTLALYIVINFIASLLYLYVINTTYPQFLSSYIHWFAAVILLNILYGLSGTFSNPIRKSRAKELILTINQSLIVSILILSFGVSQVAYTITITLLFNIIFNHFIILYLTRLSYLTLIKKLLQKRKIGFNTLLIGNNKKAQSIFNEITLSKKSLGFNLIGLIEFEESKKNFPKLKLDSLGYLEDLANVIECYKIEEVIIAIESSQHHQLKSIFDKLENTKVIIHIIPDVYDIISGFVKIDYLFSIPLITLHKDIMPFWQRIIKRTFDYLISTLVLILFSPVYLLIAIIIKLTSSGSVIYSQERIGKNGIPFKIYKFRTMVEGAELNGPQLSKNNDTRITSIGKFLRQFRLDELPQFFNILKGEMSVVGPRPERKYYIDLISEKAPHYHYLHQVLPGITSWGQVKFGYAENIEQMIKRLTFDIIYIKNRSLSLDFKIIFYTFIIILQRRGK